MTTPVGPLLTVTGTNTSQIFLSRPYPSTGFNLETTTNLTPAIAWSPVTNSVSNNGLLNYVILNVNTNDKARFFRLHNP